MEAGREVDFLGNDWASGRADSWAKWRSATWDDGLGEEDGGGWTAVAWATSAKRMAAAGCVLRRGCALRRGNDSDAKRTAVAWASGTNLAAAAWPAA